MFRFRFLHYPLLPAYTHTHIFEIKRKLSGISLPLSARGGLLGKRGRGKTCFSEMLLLVVKIGRGERGRRGGLSSRRKKGSIYDVGSHQRSGGGSARRSMMGRRKRGKKKKLFSILSFFFHQKVAGGMAKEEIPRR